ncbi:EAL domain-containing protein [Mesorhizobium sp. NBSH29]|uniref:EAL domain-containing protein n=1 Tax=Mesorhizobium sp. NBSH29 TaxID=2654249 RepID=UPI0018965D50|nr:EAL domain-containing protein [Mesorhizobium sp. NBSH29]
MSGFSADGDDFGGGIFADEVGLEYAIYGQTRLKTAFQPIFRAQGLALLPFAVEARVAPRLQGVAVAAGEFLAQAPRGDRAMIEAACRTIHVRNHAQLGVDDPSTWPLYISVDARHGLDAVQFASIAALADEAGIPVGNVICEIADAVSIEDAQLAALATSARSAGLKLSVAAFRADRAAIEQVARIEPDVIKIDGAWFRNVQDRAETALLFPAVATAFKGLGSTLLVQGIENGAELAAALDAGADWMQGNLLAEAALAGTIVDETSISIDRLVLGDVQKAHQRG